MPRDAVIITANLALLEQAFELLDRLPAGVYAEPAGAARPVGPHFRHILDHYSSFLAGCGARRIDYDRRQREAAIENDPAAARRRIEKIVAGIARLDAGKLDQSTEARVECGLGEEAEQWSGSTIRRELHFLLSHTIHHFALIGLMLRLRGVEVGAGFGVAPSTLKYWESQAACAPQAG